VKRFAFVVLLMLLCPLIACDGQENNNVEFDAAVQPTDRSDPWDDSPGDFDDDDDNDDNDPGDDDAPFNPAEKGPYEVGNTTRIFIDPTRVDFWGERELMTEIWYPAAPEAAQMEVDTVDQFLGQYIDLLATIFGLLLPEEELQNFYAPTRSVRDAPIAAGGPWPVVVFGHGNGGVRFQNMHLCEHLASHGFVVLSCDHTGNAAVSPLPSGLIIFNPIAMPFEFFWRQSDLSFLIDAADWLNEYDPEGVFTGKIDAERCAVGGHSFGGVAAQEQTKHDQRIQAMFSLAGFSFPFAFDQIQAPGLFFWGWEDHTLIDLNVVQATQAYEKWPQTKVWVSVNDAGHYSWTDVCDLVPTLMGSGDGCGEGERLEDGSPFNFVPNETMYDLMNYYVTSFLAWALRGDDMWESLTTNVYPEQINMYWSIQ